jgi:hypothetical protein
VTDVERLLVDALHRDSSRLDATRVAQLDDAGWDALLALAARQHVRPQLHRRLNQPDLRDRVPARFRAALRTVCTAIARRNLELHAELLRLLERFDAAGIPVVLLKGMHLATGVYADIARREIFDIDVLVPRERLREATAIVLDAGYAPREDVVFDDYVAVHHHVVPLENAAAVTVELHWNVALPRFSYSIDPAGLWNGIETVEVFGRRAQVLSPQHALLHLSMHMALQHQFEFGLRPLCDISALVEKRAADLDWARVRRQADEWNWTRGVALALRLARDLVGAAIPETAAGAFELDALPAAVVDAAIAVSLAGGEKTHVPSRSMAGLRTPDATGKIRHLTAIFATTPEDLRRMYPRVPRSRWIWWSVYVLRLRDLLSRHGATLLRAFVVRDRHLRSTLDHQRQLELFLFTDR